MLMRVAKSVVLCAEDDQQLRILSKRKRVEARVQLRARIVLLAASGMSDKDIGRKLDTEDRKSVVSGKSVSVRVDLGGRRIIKQKNNARTAQSQQSFLNK